MWDICDVTFDYAPMLPNRGYQYLELKKVGWGFGRTQWASLFEPNPIIESLYWPLWWLSFGYLYMNFQTGEKNDTHLKQQAENMIQSR